MGQPHSTEARYYIFGRSDAERPLFLIFIFRGRIGPVTSVRVFSGPTMDKDEVAWFEDHI
ncbi:MAG: hypothetical protein FJX76_15080 [Armatimonadetes bacterium]|nr:hypothetical protein [Armatimonadota bacterium]